MLSLNELLDLITSENISVSNLLLKTKLYAKHIKDTELLNWCESELEGYKSYVSTPDYRKFNIIKLIGEFQGVTKELRFGKDEMLIIDKVSKIYDPISSIETLDKSKSRIIQYDSIFNVANELIQIVNGNTLDRLEIQVPENTFSVILELVKIQLSKRLEALMINTETHPKEMVFKNFFEALINKNIINILIGDKNLEEMEDIGKYNKDIKMPYLKGYEICEISEKFGIIQNYPDDKLSRWEYFKILLEGCIQEDRINELLLNVFSMNNFRNHLSGLADKLVIETHSHIVTRAIERINGELIFSGVNLNYDGKTFNMGKSTTTKQEIMESETLNHSDRLGMLKLVLHEKISGISYRKFKDEYYAEAVEAAFKEINARLKAIYMKYRSNELDGTILYENVFSTTNPLLKIGDLQTQSEKNEQLGYQYIFKGSWMSIRSPKAHANITISEDEAFDRLILASMLMKKIDALLASNNLSEA
jgi:uncharacterized protein (TIGR02391 family)